MGWWRRNRWGLVALVPAMAGMLALSAENVYHEIHTNRPSEPVPVTADGRYELRGTLIRLVGLSQATDLRRYDGSAFVAGSTITIWRARIEFTSPQETRLSGGCTIALEDGAGRVFDDDPSDLLDGASGTVSSGCDAGFDAPDKNRYVNSVYFALPRDAKPVAIRIYDALTLPRYARLTPG